MFWIFSLFLILNHAKLCIFWIVLQLIAFLVISKSLWQGRKDARFSCGVPILDRDYCMKVMDFELF